MKIESEQSVQDTLYKKAYDPVWMVSLFAFLFAWKA